MCVLFDAYYDEFFDDVYDDVVWRCLIDDVKQWCFLQMCVLFDAYYDEFFDDAFWRWCLIDVVWWCVCSCCVFDVLLIRFCWWVFIWCSLCLFRCLLVLLVDCVLSMIFVDAIWLCFLMLWFDDVFDDNLWWRMLDFSPDVCLIICFIRFCGWSCLMMLFWSCCSMMFAWCCLMMFSWWCFWWCVVDDFWMMKMVWRVWWCVCRCCLVMLVWSCLFDVGLIFVETCFDDALSSFGYAFDDLCLMCSDCARLCFLTVRFDNVFCWNVFDVVWL